MRNTYKCMKNQDLVSCSLGSAVISAVIVVQLKDFSQLRHCPVFCPAGPPSKLYPITLLFNLSGNKTILEVNIKTIHLVSSISFAAFAETPALHVYSVDLSSDVISYSNTKAGFLIL